MSATTHEARVVWNGTREDIRAHTIYAAGQAIAGSCQPSFGGDPDKADPEELFVASLSACHMLWFLDFSRRERLRVASYEDEAEGTMDGRSFTRVVLRPKVEFSERELGRAKVDGLHERAHEACFIANSVRCPVAVEPR